MMKTVVMGVFICGGGILGYVSRNYWGQDSLALAIIGLIGVGFGLGIWELWKKSQELSSFSDELDAFEQLAPSQFDPAGSPPLSGLSGPLRGIVLGRLFGKSSPVSPSFGTNYLLGLLVMLGLLGTFFGLVETLQGARAVLAGSNEIETMREGLVAPIVGLSRAFGTSVGGVASSALLGLLATVVRRQRLEVHRQIQQLIVGSLAPWSMQGRQVAAMESFSEQLVGIPVMVNSLHEMKASMESLTETIVDKQEALGEKMASVLVEVSNKVSETMADGAKLWVDETSTQLRPILEQAVDSAGRVANTHFENWTLALDKHALANRDAQEQWSGHFNGLLESLVDTLNRQECQRLDTLNEQLSTLIEQFKVGLLGLGEENRERLGRFETTVGRFEVSMEQLLSQISVEHAGLGNRLVDVSREFQEHQNTLVGKLNEYFKNTCSEFVGILGDAEKTHFANAESAVAAVAKLDVVVREQLKLLGDGLGDSLSEVIESASLAPQLAADVLNQVQSRLEAQMKRENELIADRAELFGGLADVATRLSEAATGHEVAIKLMTEVGNTQLEKVGEVSQLRLEAALKEISEASQLIGVGGHELAAMTEMFTVAVDEYRSSNDKLVGGLDRIEDALGRAGERSDQQLNLYVSQAREIIDQSMLSQKEVFDELKDLRLQKRVEENA